jgi:predicted nucleic acid-binding protein
MAMLSDSPPLIADTSGIVSLFVENDSNHARATEATAHIAPSIPILVSPEVFSESINVLGRKSGHSFAIEAANYLLTQHPFQLLETQKAVLLAALEKFAEQRTSVSFTDCVVMATADEYETKAIFGFDTCFAQSGYHLP